MPGKRSPGGGPPERATDRPLSAAQRRAVARQIRLDEKVRKAGLVQNAGFFSNLGDAADVVVKDAKNLAVGTVSEAIKGAGAAATVLGPHASLSERKKALGVLGGQLAGIPKGVEAVVPNPSRLPFGDVSLLQWNDGVVPDFWVRGGERGDSALAKKMWTERPVTSFLTAAGVASPVAGAGSIARIAKNLMGSDSTLSRSAAYKLARKESRNPGYLATQGLDGGLGPRTLRSTVEDKSREVQVPQSRSALGRGYQQAADFISREMIPEGKLWSERRRANRAIQRAQDYAQKVENARVASRLRPVRDLGYGRFGKPSKPEQALMTYALQTPKTADVLAGPRKTAGTLDSILEAGGYTFREDDGFVWHSLSEHERAMLQAQTDGIRKALDNPPDPEALTAAVDALEGIAQAAENIGLYVALGRAAGKPPAVAQAIRDGFAERRNALARRVGMQGEARGYFPHTAETEPSPSSFAGATRRPATGDVLGVPRSPLPSHRNKLIVFQGGRLNVDLRVLVSAYYKRLKFLWAEEQRRDLYHEALPVSEIAAAPRGKGYFVRNPDATPTTLKPEQRLLTDPETAAQIARDAADWDSRVDSNFFEALRDWRDDAFQLDDAGLDGLPAEWKQDIANVRWLPKDVVETRVKHVFAQKPDGILAPTIATLNSLARLATIQGKPARYVASNTVQNLLMATLTSPKAALRGAGNQASLLRSVPRVDRMWKALRLPTTLRDRRRDLYDLAVVETGDILATAGLPEFYIRAQTAPQKIERTVTDAQQWLGSREGTLADTQYRLAVWQQHARRYGFDSDEKLEALLTSQDPAIKRVKGEIRQRTRDDMLDFDRLSPFERENISRFFFIWPFVRASLRWPATFARDYPGRAGVAAAVASEHEDDGMPRSSRDLFTVPVGGGEYNVGWALPYAPAVEKLSAANQLRHTAPKGDLSPVTDTLAPWARTGVDALGGQGNPTTDSFLDQLGRSMLPGYAPATDLAREGASGLPVVKRFTPSKGDRRLSRSTRERRDADKQKLNAAMRKAWENGKPLPPQDEVQASFDAWWLYQELSRRARYGVQEEGRTKATAREKAVILNRVAREKRPDLQIHPDRTIRTAKDESTLDAYVEWMYEQLFTARRQALAADDQ